jgi:uracil-DNA glycosylase family 4
VHSGKVTRDHPRTGATFASPVPPGSGWPGDPATPNTPVALTPAHVEAMAAATQTPQQLDAEVSVCRACPRLVSWREQVAVTKRRSFQGEPYWGRPVPGWGAQRPRLVILGLAPAAHGGNRTGRVFTGDRSGDVLFAALHRAGLATSGTSTDAADGLELNHTRIMAAVRCAPPDNAPTPVERSTCMPWLDAEWRLMGDDVRVIVALGAFAWRAALQMVGNGGGSVGSPLPRFGHGATAALRTPRGEVVLVGCYHPSQQNTFTGRLTPAMLDDIVDRAKTEAGIP